MTFSVVLYLKGKKDCDVTMVIGHFEYCQEALLLNLRFNEEVQDAKHFGKIFFNDAKRNLNVGKRLKEVWRKGGSSGIACPETDADFFKFMHNDPSSSPLKTRALKIIRDQLCYAIFYITPYEEKRRAVPVTYSIPRMGGGFRITEEHFRNFDFLSTFAQLKINAVLIVYAINLSNIVPLQKPICLKKQQVLRIRQCFMSTIAPEPIVIWGGTRVEVRVFIMGNFITHCLIGELLLEERGLHVLDMVLFKRMDR